MPKVLVTEGHLNDIAEAIRSKNGAATTYRPGDMADAIEALDTSGIHPTGTKNITANGTHDVTQYASASVNVQPNLQSKTVTENGTVTPDSGYDGLSSVVVNVSGGGGGASGILAGTSAPTAAEGSEGDVYLQCVDTDTGATPHTYVLTIVSALRGSSSLTYAGAAEIDLILDDGNGNELSIRDIADFTYNGRNGNGNNYNVNNAFDGKPGTYAEGNPTPLTINLTATIPSGYAPKALKAMQRSDSYNTDVWEEFVLTDTAMGIESEIAAASDLTTSDWAGANNWTTFPCSGGVSGVVVTNCYVKGASAWVEVTKAAALNAIVQKII